MGLAIELKPVLELPADIELLRIEASTAGFRFMEKLVKEWESKANRFDKKGEMLIGAYHNARLVAVGGLNIDPYVDDPSIARLRHLYVLKPIRRQGVASSIARYLLDTARTSFSGVRLFTDTAEAAALYEKLGFTRANCVNATHIIRFR
ncbi:GNAT family N-acetyltransferase [Rhizobium sp. 2MFCol3.1]|uniref:GNAT family N-acetyltransferase n=1 Tax=Rhizobium sp. 2MFCol3.1 TaxID=1246459 RepID=UPI00036E026C|nr:GNAT family N-acetyltransferase [Rhizobium sp. 2MFCol3.1]